MTYPDTDVTITRAEHIRMDRACKRFLSAGHDECFGRIWYPRRGRGVSAAAVDAWYDGWAARMRAALRAQ